MAKVINIEKKTHAYILEDGTVVRAINPAHVELYQKDKVNVYSCPATKTVDGVKVDTQNYYVDVDKFVKRSTAGNSLKSKLSAVISSRDLSTMSATDLLALLS